MTAVEAPSVTLTFGGEHRSSSSLHSPIPRSNHLQKRLYGHLAWLSTFVQICFYFTKFSLNYVAYHRVPGIAQRSRTLLSVEISQRRQDANITWADSVPYQLHLDGGGRRIGKTAGKFAPSAGAGSQKLGRLLSASWRDLHAMMPAVSVSSFEFQFS